MRTHIVLLLNIFVSLNAAHAASHYDYLIISRSAPPPIYNDYSEERYNTVLDRFIEIMQPAVGARGGELKILRDWSDGAVNAWAWREGSEYWLEVPGGAAKYYLINEEAFLATLCHELGHLMGGAPKSLQISYEGQSDYYSAAKCLRVVLPKIEPFKKLDPTDETKRACAKWSSETDRFICERSLIGALSLTSYYAQLEKTSAPLISTPSHERVTKTLQAHPKAQCRLDTYVAGALCAVPATEDFGEQDAKTGACHQDFEPQHARPGCWYAP